MKARFAILAVLLFAATPTLAQSLPAQGAAAPPDAATVELNQDWLALSVATQHVQKSLMAYMSEANAARAAAAQSESRLEWVLNNWVGVPKAK